MLRILSAFVQAALISGIWDMADHHKTKRCPVCDEPIGIAARKCIHCNSYLNYRRLFVFGNDTLALLTALLAVLGTLLPPLYREFIQDKNSSIKLTFASNGTDEANDKTIINFIASNAGQRAGSISSGAIDVQMPPSRKDSEDTSFFIYLVAPGGTPFIVAPGQTKLVSMVVNYIEKAQSLAYHRFLAIDPMKDLNVGLCSFQINVVNFDGIVEPMPVPLLPKDSDSAKFCSPNLMSMVNFIKIKKDAILR
jgi:hypothetical protein